MNSQDKDEAKARRREEMLARRVGEALDRMNPHGAEECPDAEIVAAYAEQALGPAEVVQWESHFASCARCRNILHVLAASSDVPLAEKEVTQLGKLITTRRPPNEIKGELGVHPRLRFLDWRMRWLAPAFGVAAALAVWFAIRPPWRATNRSASETLVAQAPKEELPPSSAPAPMDQLSKAAPQDAEKAPLAPSLDRSSKKKDALLLNAPAEESGKRREDAANQIGGFSRGASNSASSLQGDKKLSSLPDGNVIQPPAIPAASPPLPKAQAAMAAPAAPQSSAKPEFDSATAKAPQLKENESAAEGMPLRDKQAVVAQSETGATASGAVRQQALSELRANTRSDQAMLVLRPVQKYSSLTKALSGSALWRAGTGGIIERSSDAGKTWASQASPSQEDWLAGAAVSDAVCWLAGRNGAIARTVDGVNWVRIPAPVQAAGNDGKLPDWAGITARDAQSATIAAGDGRHFATADGGKTWQIQ